MKEWEIKGLKSCFNDNKLHKGERIFHQKFGYGTILNIDGDKVEIKFEKSDIKKVLMSFIEKTN